jgi:hypothetical protein
MEGIFAFQWQRWLRERATMLRGLIHCWQYFVETCYLHLEGGWNQCVSFVTLCTSGLSFAAPVFVKLIGKGTAELRREIHLHK